MKTGKIISWPQTDSIADGTSASWRRKMFSHPRGDSNTMQKLRRTGVRPLGQAAWRNRPGPKSELVCEAQIRNQILATLLTSAMGQDDYTTLSGWLGMSGCRRSRRKWTRAQENNFGQFADVLLKPLKYASKKGACSAQKQDDPHTHATKSRRSPVHHLRSNKECALCDGDITLCLNEFRRG